MIYMQGSSFLNIFSCKFIENYADDSSFIFADNNPEGLITINNSYIANHTSHSNLFYLIYTNAVI